MADRDDGHAGPDGAPLADGDVRDGRVEDAAVAVDKGRRRDAHAQAVVHVDGRLDVREGRARAAHAGGAGGRGGWWVLGFCVLLEELGQRDGAGAWNVALWVDDAGIGQLRLLTIGRKRHIN